MAGSDAQPHQGMSVFKNTEPDTEQFLLQRTIFKTVFCLIILMLTTQVFSSLAQDLDF